MNCLVTGGGGFIGSHLVERLIADGHVVDVWDDWSTGSRSNVDARVRYVTTVDVAGYRMDFPDIAYDWIFHLAGRATLLPSIDAPCDYISANVLGATNVLEHARRTGCQRLIYAASSSCYGQYPVTPTDENQPVKPAHPYALSKRLGEEAVLHWGDVYGIDTVSLRLFNVYGPRSRSRGAYGAVMRTFLAQRAVGAPLTIIGDGTQARDFVWVEDVVDAFVRAASADADGSIFNIGTGQATSINRLAALIGGPIVRIPPRGGEPWMTQADNRKAQRELDWRPRVTIAEGVARLLQLPEHEADVPCWTSDAIAKATETWHKYLG